MKTNRKVDRRKTWIYLENISNNRLDYLNNKAYSLRLIRLRDKKLEKFIDKEEIEFDKIYIIIEAIGVKR